MHQVTIREVGGAFAVLLDGVDVGRGVTAFHVIGAADRCPRVTLELVPLGTLLDLDATEVDLADLKLPEVLERKLLALLKAKYP